MRVIKLTAADLFPGSVMVQPDFTDFMGIPVGDLHELKAGKAMIHYWIHPEDADLGVRPITYLMEKGKIKRF